MPNLAIQTQSLTKNYGSVRALRGGNADWGFSNSLVDDDLVAVPGKESRKVSKKEANNDE